MMKQEPGGNAYATLDPRGEQMVGVTLWGPMGGVQSGAMRPTEARRFAAELERIADHVEYGQYAADLYVKGDS